MFQAIVPMEKREDFPQTPEVLELLQRVFDLCKRLNDARQELVEEAKKVQSDCDHDFKRIMVLDEHYCSRLDGRGREEEEVFVGEKCAKCNFFRQRKRGHPWQVCFKCGGPMKHNRMELFGQDRVHVNKCQDCGHEHDTT